MSVSVDGEEAHGPVPPSFPARLFLELGKPHSIDALLWLDFVESFNPPPSTRNKEKSNFHEFLLFT
jgi:hypothetical protein